jgi:hypothetical protein
VSVANSDVRDVMISCNLRDAVTKVLSVMNGTPCDVSDFCDISDVCDAHDVRDSVLRAAEQSL